jgi:hypothetical protein
MGILCPPTGRHTIPWFRSDHRLQDNKYFHDGLRVGACGCLTTCKYHDENDLYRFYLIMFRVVVVVSLFLKSNLFFPIF